MKKIKLTLLIAMLVLTTTAAHAECAKTLMGNDCETNGKGVAAHMRGNAVENAKASKALKAAKAKAKARAVEISKAQKKDSQ